MEIIKDILNGIYKLYKSSIYEEKADFAFYVTDIFEKTKIIQENYTRILSSLRYNITYDDWKGDDVLKYLLKIEYELKSDRVYIRETLKSINKMYDWKLEKFVEGVFEIMYCEYVVDRFKTKEMEHRFSGLIRDAKYYREYPRYKKDFLDNIDYMLNNISYSWKIVCIEYLKLKQQIDAKK